MADEGPKYGGISRIISFDPSGLDPAITDAGTTTDTQLDASRLLTLDCRMKVNPLLPLISVPS